MQAVTTLPVLQAVSDSTDHYLGLQPIIKGRTNAQYVNGNLRFNPSSNTLTLDANLNLRSNSINAAAISGVLRLTGGTVNGPVTFQNEVSVANNFSFNSGYGSSAVAYGCRAWVNFNGTGTVAIRASGNVSSITDNGTGDYTVNFTTAMPDINYCSLVTGTSFEGNNISGESKLRDTSTNKLAGSVRMQFTINDNQTAYDSPNANLAIFR